MNTQEIIPPNDLHVEKALLSALVTDPRVIDRLGDRLTGSDFYDPGHGQFFDAVKLLHDSGKPIKDGSLLRSELVRLRLPEELTSTEFLSRLMLDGNGHVTHVPLYAKQLKTFAVLREHLRIALDLQQKAADAGSDPAELSGWVESQLMGLGQQMPVQARDIGEVAQAIAAELREPKSTTPGVTIGIQSHDSMVGGYQNGELIVIAARANVGKTALAQTAAENVANDGKPVLFVSLEMTETEVVKRILCGRSGVDSRRLRSGNYQEPHIRSIEREAENVASLPIKVWAPYSATVPQIRATAKQMQVTEGLALLVIDYIGLIKPEDHRLPRHEQVARISRSLKGLAKELGVPILALCQLNREAEKDPPKLSMLRDSGAIEQDADLVLLLHRIRGETDAQLIVAKHRHGEVGEIPLRWNSVRMAYEDAMPEEDEFERDRQTELAMWDGVNQDPSRGPYGDFD